MSAINSGLPNSAVQSTTATTPNSFAALTPQDFIKMMVTQLQNQDPLNPTNSQDLLSQMSQIGQLQSSTQLQTTLTGLTLQNQIGSASSLIGKTVQGSDSNNKSVSGTVTGVSITQTPAAQSPTGQATSNVTLTLDSGSTLPLSNVTSIAPAPTQTVAATQTPATPGPTSTVPGL